MSLAFAVLAVLAPSAPSTSPAPGETGSHQAWLGEIKSAQARALQAALEDYDAHLREHPNDAVAAVERCKLIAAAAASRGEDDYDDADEQVGPSHADCLKGLEEQFPESALAVSYRIDLRWGEEASALAEQALSNPRLNWTDADRAHLHAKLSRVHSIGKKPQQAAREAWLAMSFDPSLDLTRDLASGLLAEGRRSEAIVALSSRTDGAWYELQNKARMLADAGAFKRALWLMDLAKAKAGHADPLLEARILEGAGKLDQARQIYAGREHGWNRLEVLGRRFNLDLETGDRESAVRSYQELRDVGWKADPLGRYRLALLRKAPGAGWRVRDLLGLLGLFGSILFFVLLPGLLLVPLHHFSLWRRLRTGRGVAAVPWRFRGVWLVAATMLVVQFFALYLFDYGEVASWFTQQAQKDTPPHALAAFALWDSVALAALLGAMALSREDRRRFLGPGSWSLRQTIGKVLITLLLLLVANYINKAVFHGSPTAPGALRVDEVIRAMIRTYGVGVSLLALAVLTPIAEELVFRAALLDLFATELPFWLANLAQGAIFAAIHLEPRQFLPLLVLALLAGGLRRASGGLLPAILLHGANNALAVTAVALAAWRPPVPPVPAPMHADRELIGCAGGLGESPLRPAAGALEQNPSPSLLNKTAWALALERDTSHGCLLKAEEAIDAALRQRPETAAFLDTKATVLFRQRRLDEAIDLERAAAELSPGTIHFSQLNRFLRKRRLGAEPIVIGRAATSPKLTLESRDEEGRQAIRFETAGVFEDGAVFYALIADTLGEKGLLEVALGPKHEGSYRLRLPKRMSDFSVDARFDVALVDSRGCERCAPGFWRWAVYPHERSVDSYP